ncbi:MAG: ABC transporter ATP-binding protein [Anaerolineales bacterium]|nr:ABC transporter ATP-binding protein [Anaerolineales bacterium]
MEIATSEATISNPQSPISSFMSEERKRKKRTDVNYIPLIGIDARYLRYLTPYVGLLVLSVIMIVLVALLDIIAPWPVKYIIDNVIGGRPLTGPVGDWLLVNVGTDQRLLTAVLGLALLIIVIFQGATSFAYEYLSGLIQERSTFYLRTQVFQHVQRLPLAFYDQSRLGDVLKRVTEDAGKIMVALVGSMGEMLINIVKFLGFAGVMLFVNWRFSVIVLAYVPLLLFLYITFRRNIRDTASEAREQEGEMMNLTLETLGAIREVKAFGREDYQQALFEEYGEKRIRSGLRSIRWEASFSPIIDFVQAASTAAIIWYGVSQVLIGQFSVGELLIFMSYLKDMYSPLRKFSKLAATLQKAAASGDRLGKILDTPITVEETANPRPLGRARGNVQFKGVEFYYPTAPDKPILRGVNLTVQAGQVVALVGGTGAGKSTLASLLLRFYEISNGRIVLDGADIREYRLEDLRQQFGIVPQESVLFATSIRQNIAYGRPEATDDEIVAAAKAANAHGFIQQLPNGYDTVVGERGGTLSGGQRQRIAIARALLRDAPILILDEPTAALDAESEDLVMGALDRLMQGRTTFIIAHRLSTIRDADQIVVMDKGRVVETGRHEELLAQNGHYAYLVQLQTGTINNGLSTLMGSLDRNLVGAK